MPPRDRTTARRVARLVVGAALAVAGAATGASGVATFPAAYRVTVGPDGSFSPAELHIHNGDTVEWRLPDRARAIVATSPPASPGTCPVPRAFEASDPSNFTGPMPFAPSGVFVMSPLETGNRVEKGACAQGRAQAGAGGDVLCDSGPPFATLDSTWNDPNATGVFIRLLWNRTQLAPGTDDASFDFRELDREVEKAVRAGKLYSLAFKAGLDGTPAWMFSTPPATRPAGRAARGRAGRRGGAGRGAAGAAAPAAAGTGGVARLSLQDGGNNGRGCGPRMDLGNPTDPAYQRHYFDLLRKVAAHLRARSDWYRALAYIKPSGANLISHENRLPKECTPGCVCNPQVFADAGYTPSGLYDFYRRQFDLIAREFPGKAMSYALIQDGFPLVNDSGGWAQADGRSSNGRPLPRGTEQTETILKIGHDAYGARFVVQHNGLQPQPPKGTCPNENDHPARPPYARAGTGCPNHWVLRSGSDGQSITGLQTNNASGVRTPAEVESAFENARINSDASFVEIYEERFWDVTHTNGGALPGGRTIAEWADRFHERRRSMFKKLPDPFPTTYRFTFKLRAPAAGETLYYFDPSTCRPSSPRVGTIAINR